MSQPSHNTYALLGLVKEHIKETINKACRALELYVENPEDEEGLTSCALGLHQIHGALQILELYGAGMLTTELEHLTHALIDNKVSQREDAYEILMYGMLQLSNYLEALQQGKPDFPIIFLPLVNDIRAVRNAKLLSEGALFSPDLSIIAPLTQHKSPDSIEAHIRSMRKVFHLGLINWFKGKDLEIALKRVILFFAVLRTAANENVTRQMLWVSIALIEAIRDEGLQTSVAIKILMGQLDRQFKSILDNSEKHFAAKPPKNLIKNLLYYVGRSKSNGHFVSQIKQAFHLDQILPDPETLSIARSDLSAPNNDLIDSVTTILIENLAEIKVHLDVFMRSHEREPEILTELSGKLPQIADALDMLGQGTYRNLIQEQITQLDSMGSGKTTISNEGLMQIADALVLIETKLTEPDNLEMHRWVIDEIKIDIAKVKETFNQEKWESEKPMVLQEVPNLLNRIRGSMLVMNLERCATVLDNTSTYMQDEVINQKQAPNEQIQSHLANIISSIEYYLELFLENSVLQDTILEAAEMNLQALGVKSA